MVHSVRNTGEGWGRIVFLAAPRDRHRRFFESQGTPLAAGEDPPTPAGPPDVDRLLAVGRECGIHFVAPPAPVAEAEDARAS